MCPDIIKTTLFLSDDVSYLFHYHVCCHLLSSDYWPVKVFPVKRNDTFSLYYSHINNFFCKYGVVGFIPN